MPGRDIPLISDQIYHVFNRGVARQPTYTNKRDYRRFLDTAIFYRYLDTPIRYSKFLYLTVSDRESIQKAMAKSKKVYVEILGYCLMPNHFHFLIRQKQDGGISKYIGTLTNSYTRYFNTKNKRAGPLFQGKFKAVRIETDEQLLHVLRYIHLNPYTSYLVKSPQEIVNTFSSLSNYLNDSSDNFIDTNTILDQFKSVKSFKRFTYDQADYQRELENIKHLILEK